MHVQSDSLYKTGTHLQRIKNNEHSENKGYTFHFILKILLTQFARSLT